MAAKNVAAQRGAKASRRKAIVAQKCKIAAAEASVAGQVLRAAALPIRACRISEELFETGMGTLVLARGLTVGPIFFEVYLLDTFCRGVKDIDFRTLGQGQLDTYLDLLEVAGPLVEVDPPFARKLVRDLVRWSGSIGFGPPGKFATLERLFGDVDPDACTTEFKFGQAGKPFYISGPDESPRVGLQAIRHLEQEIGEGNFEYLVVSSDPIAAG